MSEGIDQGPPVRTLHACGDLNIHIYNPSVWDYIIPDDEPEKKKERTLYTQLITDNAAERSELTRILLHGTRNQGESVAKALKAMHGDARVAWLRWDFTLSRAYIAVYP